MSDWYAQNSIQLEKLRETNRAAMMNSDKTFVAQIEPIQPGTEWDRYLDIYINKVAVCLSRTFSFTIVIITQVLVQTFTTRGKTTNSITYLCVTIPQVLVQTYTSRGKQQWQNSSSIQQERH